MNETGHRLLALVVGAVVAGALFVVTAAPLLSLVVGIETVVGVLLFLRVRREHPQAFTGEGWREGRWTAVGTVAFVLGALLGVSPLLSIEPGLRLGLSTLVLATGLATYTAGYLSVLERGDVVTVDNSET